MADDDLTPIATFAQFGFYTLIGSAAHLDPTVTANRDAVAADLMKKGFGPSIVTLALVDGQTSIIARAMYMRNDGLTLPFSTAAYETFTTAYESGPPRDLAPLPGLPPAASYVPQALPPALPPEWTPLYPNGVPNIAPSTPLALPDVPPTFPPYAPPTIAPSAAPSVKPDDVKKGAGGALAMVAVFAIGALVAAKG